MTIELGGGEFSVAVITPMTGCFADYGPRFDTVGAVSVVTCRGQSFLVREGLIDEFNIQAPIVPPGYEEARPGEAFVKIGVGELIRLDDKDYNFTGQYPVKQLVPVVMEREGNILTLSQTLRSGTGYEYVYSKTYEALPGTATLVIRYSMKNIGEHSLHAEHYNHNWFNFGGQAIDGNYFVETHFGVSEGDVEWFARGDRRVDITRHITAPCYFPSRKDSKARDNWMLIGHRACDQSVIVSGDFDVARFALYADKTALCPEVFGEFRLLPGHSIDWQRTYEFRA